MKILIMVGGIVAALLSGCTATTGPQYDARHIQVGEHAAYEIACKGLMESGYVCVDMAKRICLDKRVEPLDPITGKESDFEALQDRRILVFACADPVMPTVTAPSPLAAAPAPMKSVATMLIATEVLFYFDQSDLAGMTAQGREALQKVIERLSAIAPQAVRISGYTDRIGSDAYNLALSTRRANAVKQYLQTHGVTIPIMANGYGKRTPGIDCPTPDRMRLVACLAPDRVVEIELMGRASRQ